MNACALNMLSSIRNAALRDGRKPFDDEGRVLDAELSSCSAVRWCGAAPTQPFDDAGRVLDAETKS